MKKILIIGAGYVGFTVAVALASFGNKVFLFDKNRAKIDLLSSSIIPFHEPGLSNFFRHVKNNISLTSELKKCINESEIIFVTVGTSVYDNKVDLTDYKEAITDISKLLEESKIIVIKSTIPVDAIQWTKNEIRKYFKGDFSLVLNPEFLREGNALNDFLHPDRIVIGVEDEHSKDELLKLYEPIDAPKLITDLKTASMIKYVSNSFLATKISFINEISDICELFDVDIKEVAYAVGLDRRIGKDYLSAGIGFGGSCLLKDVSSLINMSENKEYSPKLIKAVKEINSDRIDLFINKVETSLENDDKVLGVWGLSFKPNTDDIRGSQSVEIIKKLLDLGYSIKAYDPKANENAKILFVESIEIFDDPFSAVKDASALLVLTDWLEFRDIDLTRVKSLMKKPYLFDGRNLYDPETIVAKGFKYFGIGRSHG